MAKALVIDYEKCVGCGTCKMVCSAKQEDVVSPSLSRIQPVKWPLKVEVVPMVCVQCESAQCHAICPVKAISRDEQLCREMIDYDICIGCRMCVAVCPFGCMNFDSIDKRVFKCDLCGGDPMCVRFCQYDALQYVEAGEASTMKRTATAEKLSGIMHKIASAGASF